MSNKILFVYYKLFKAGGVARVLVSLANELVSDNNEITILILTKDTSSFYDLDKRVKIISIDTFSHWGFTKINVNLNKYFPKMPYKNNIKNYIYDFGQWEMLSKWINSNYQDYDMVISCWYKLSAQLALNKNVAHKTIAWEHANFEVGGIFWKKLLRKKYNKLKSIVCLNNDSLNYYQRINPFSFKIANIIGNPFELVKENIISEKENTLIFVGRLDEDKNVREILEIISKINLNDFIFKIIGEGPSKESLELEVNNNNLDNQVLLLGRLDIDDIFNELSKSKIFLFTSKTECLPTVLLEAIMLGNVLISYNCNYGPSDIINENNGFLIPMNDKKLFQEKLQYLIDTPKELENLSHTSYLDSKKWKKNEIIKKWEKILNL